MAETRRDVILTAVDDLVIDFIYYHRKEDEDLPKGHIEEAIYIGEISIAEIVERFAARLRESI